MDTFCFFVTWQKHQSNPSTENQLSKSFLVHIVVWCTTETEHTATWLIDLGNGSPEQPCLCHCLASLTYNRTSDTIMTQRYRLQHQRVQWKVSLSKYVPIYIVAALLCFSAEQNIIDKKMCLVPYGASLMGKTPLCSRVSSLIDLRHVHVLLHGV